MQHNAQLLRSGGAAVAAGALLYAVGAFIHPAAGAEAADAAMLRWAHWAQLFAAFFMAAGVLGLSRAWAHSAAESWAVMAAAGVLLSSAVFIITPLAEFAAGEAGAALLAGTGAVVEMGRVVAWFSVAALGMAILRDASLPRWLAYGGLAVAAVELVGEFVVAGATLRWVWMLGFAYLAAAGVVFVRAAAPKPAREPAREPARQF